MEENNQSHNDSINCLAKDLFDKIKKLDSRNPT
ncbi:MAG: hypothetical protein BWX51_01383 [Bacteroidetes bacterium ADurb.Bin012]|nr:MAG: hypothetical protein BWX51_01383 [Bacteroidetes bacterium ADurb.Bin012]